MHAYRKLPIHTQKQNSTGSYLPVIGLVRREMDARARIDCRGVYRPLLRGGDVRDVNAVEEDQGEEGFLSCKPECTRLHDHLVH